MTVRVVYNTERDQNTVSDGYLYERYSVREYWIIHPIDKIIMVYQLVEKSKYARPEVYQIDEVIKIGILRI